MSDFNSTIEMLFFGKSFFNIVLLLVKLHVSNIVFWISCLSMQLSHKQVFGQINSVCHVSLTTVECYLV